MSIPENPIDDPAALIVTGGCYAPISAHSQIQPSVSSISPCN